MQTIHQNETNPDYLHVSFTCVNAAGLPLTAADMSTFTVYITKNNDTPVVPDGDTITETDDTLMPGRFYLRLETTDVNVLHSLGIRITNTGGDEDMVPRDIEVRIIAAPATLAGQVAIAAAVDAVDNFVDTEIATLLAGQASLSTAIDGLPAAVDAALTSSHGEGSWVDAGAADLSAIESQLDSIESIIAGLPSEVDLQLSSSHGEGSWEGGEGGASAADVADAVWDEARAGHNEAGSFGQGVRLMDGAITAAKFAADAITATVLAGSAAGKIRDTVLDTVLDTGRTIRGWFRRKYAWDFGEVSGLNGDLVTAKKANGTPEFQVVRNRLAGTRQSAGSE